MRPEGDLRNVAKGTNNWHTTGVTPENETLRREYPVDDANAPADPKAKNPSNSARDGDLVKLPLAHKHEVSLFYDFASRPRLHIHLAGSSAVLSTPCRLDSHP